MLALTRKSQESIIIDGGIEITVLDIQGDKVKLGIKAPKEISVYRQEIYDQIKTANQEANNVSADAITKISRLICKDTVQE